MLGRYPVLQAQSINTCFPPVAVLLLLSNIPRFGLHMCWLS